MIRGFNSDSDDDMETPASQPSNSSTVPISDTRLSSPVPSQRDADTHTDSDAEPQTSKARSHGVDIRGPSGSSDDDDAPSDRESSSNVPSRANSLSQPSGIGSIPPSLQGNNLRYAPILFAIV